jgi:DNA (cytosine-5)-methyltransferase 1
MRHLGLFEGIGGFSLAARWMGWNTVAWVEIDKFCQQVLKKNFPEAKGYGDIKEFDGTQYRGTVDIITGGFPCQPFSSAGKRKGTKDHRHLWPEMLRVIREVQPAYIVGENVYGLVNWSKGLVFEQVCADLENEGYQVQPVILPACAVNAPHRRDRVWFVAYHQSKRLQSRVAKGWTEEAIPVTTNSHQDVANTNGELCRYRHNGKVDAVRAEKETTENIGYTIPNAKQWHVEPAVDRVADGIPDRVDRIKALGNAIVPQVAYEIFKAIEQVKQETSNG